ncbi:MFS family permease [Paraburkholderia sp. GAS199]|uniref:MFS transporter n=1 Tax=Paraburkholderia sp. GAS199 TaxID=3035126 RepID=UPI003D2554E5
MSSPMIRELSPSHEDAQSMSRRATISSTIGTALEWFDFTIYGAASAIVFPKLFFPSLSPSAALLGSFATFAVGFGARPLGGVVCGYLGDRFGRRNLLLFTMALMGLATVGIGLLPTFASVGILAPILLVFFRICQGFALGGESTGAQLMALEHAPALRRGWNGALVNLGSPISQVTANGMLFILTALMPEDAFLSYGWRIPFLLSLLLVLTGLYMRRQVDESPAYQAVERRQGPVRSPLATAVTGHWRLIVRLALIYLSVCLCFYVVVVFSLSYMNHTLKIPARTGFFMLMVSNLVALPLMLLGGRCADRFGRKPTFIVGLMICFVLALSYFPLLQSGNTTIMFAAMIAFIGALEAVTGVQPALFAEPFPAKVRYTGSALAYSCANLLGASPAPFVAAYLTQTFNGKTWPISVLCAVTIVISIIAVAIGKETRGVDMTQA